MRKILAVAAGEYRQVVLTKSFLISLLFPVIIYGGLFFASAMFGDKTDLKDRTLVVVDATGVLMPDILEANQKRNRSEDVVEGGKQVGPRFVIQPYAGNHPAESRELLAELSQRVRDKVAFAFAVIGADFISVDGGDQDFIHYYSDSPTFSRLPDWLNRTVRESVEQRRLTAAGLDPKEISRLMSHNRLERFGLAEFDAAGNLMDPEKENELAAFLVPFGLIMLLFISVQMTTPVLLNSVIEEKMARIAEVLLSSLTPMQLLWGKLIGGVAVGLTFSAVYITSFSLSLRYFEKVQWVQEGTFFWFFVFLLMGMLAFGALFAGVSSACQDLKDSQNFAGVIVLLLLAPMMLSLVIIESPDTTFATIISLLPPFSVMAMLARIAIPPGPPEWQIFLSLILSALFTVAAVWAASRIFRIGILSQGKAPTWRELIRWIFQRG